MGTLRRTCVTRRGPLPKLLWADLFLRLKCTNFDFGWGSALDPAGGAYNASPDCVVVFMGLLVMGGRGGAEKGMGREGEKKGGGRGRKGHPRFVHELTPLFTEHFVVHKFFLPLLSKLSCLTLL